MGDEVYLNNSHNINTTASKKLWNILPISNYADENYVQTILTSTSELQIMHNQNSINLFIILIHALHGFRA